MQRTTLIMSKKNLIEKNREKLTVQENAHNILFAGIDLISNYLIGDINVTSPTGLKNFKDLSGIDLSIDIWNCLEK